MASKIHSIVVFIALAFVHSFAFADRPQNELPMYGGERLPFEKRWSKKSAEEIANYKTLSYEASQLGWKYFNEGLLDIAIKRFNQAWLFNPNNSHVWWGFGLIMGNRGKDENNDRYFLDSIEYLKKALTLSENNYRIMIDLSTTYTNLGVSKMESDIPNVKKAFTNALQWSIEAEQINDLDPLLWTNRAYTQSMMGLFNDAIKNYNKAIELAPDSAASYNDLAWLLATCPDANYRDGRKAIDIANKAMKLKPNNPAIYDTIAAAYAEIGKFENAVAFLEEAILFQKKEGKKDFLKGAEIRLKSYRQLKPWRERRGKE